MCHILGWGVRKRWDHDGFLMPVSMAFFILAIACPSLSVFVLQSLALFLCLIWLRFIPVTKSWHTKLMTCFIQWDVGFHFFISIRQKLYVSWNVRG